MPDRDAQARRHRRAVLRAHHPDLGGDPAEFVRQLRLLEHAEHDTGQVVFVKHPRGFRALLAWLRGRRRRAPRVR